METNRIPDEFFYVQPEKGNMFKWHFTLRGVPGSVYEHGLYHGYFLLPPDYPMSPPDIFFMNKNGRFEVDVKLCLNITSYHKEDWTPSWTIRAMTQILNTHFIVEDGGIGSITESTEKRKSFAKSSRGFVCPHCGKMEEVENFIQERHLKGVVKGESVI